MKKLLLLLFLFPLTAFADLEAHFFDVGHGDCSIILCDGEAMIIDGGTANCSQQVFNAIKNLGITDIKYAVATHPDADHIGGLPAAFRAASVQTLLTSVESDREKRFSVLLETAEKQHATILVCKAGDAFSLGGAQITILSPAIRFADSNDSSIVFRLDYGETSFLFTGDASTAVEKDLIARKANLKADVLKVSHHGSSTGTSLMFKTAVAPEYAVISCAENKEAPTKEVLYNLADTRILITAQKGNIVIRSDGTALTVETEKAPVDVTELQFVGNKNSKVFHISTCDSVFTMKDSNKVYFDTAEDAESKGYRPCKNCCPK